MDSQQLATEPAEKKKRVLSPELYPLAAHKTTDPVMEEEITQSIASMGTLTQVTQSEQQQHTAATEDIDEGIRSQCNVSVPRPYVQTASLLDRLKLKLLDWEDGDKQLDAQEYSAVNAVLTGIDYAVHVLYSNKRSKAEINVWNYSFTVVSPTTGKSEVAFLDTSFMEVLYDQQRLSSDPKYNYSTVWTLTPVGQIPASNIIPFQRKDISICGPPAGPGPYIIGNYITPGACLQLQPRSGEIFIGEKSKDPVYIRRLEMGPSEAQVTLFYFDEYQGKSDLWAIYMKTDKGRVYLRPMPPSAKGYPTSSEPVNYPPRNNIVYGLESSNVYMSHFVWRFNGEVKPKVQRPIQ